ncbi:MAG: hypothetical protein CMF49_05290 [Legionellales bacterium]|mgnify:FL=1|nr:hypothetical protein [Legionellales bacterium]MAZ39516.1 hypothetical protein [Legionellales bacterium]|tara:strand:+ start:425 stop:1138 length:714 start_codon:yes stop_codon:yes gene_type:complete
MKSYELLAWNQVSHHSCTANILSFILRFKTLEFTDLNTSDYDWTTFETFLLKKISSSVDVEPSEESLLAFVSEYEQYNQQTPPLKAYSINDNSDYEKIKISQLNKASGFYLYIVEFTDEDSNSMLKHTLLLDLTNENKIIIFDPVGKVIKEDKRPFSLEDILNIVTSIDVDYQVTGIFIKVNFKKQLVEKLIQAFNDETKSCGATQSSNVCSKNSFFSSDNNHHQTNAENVSFRPTK